MPGYAPAAEGIFVQLLLSVRKLSARATLTPGFDTRSHFAAVSEFVEAGSVDQSNFLTF